LKDREGLSLAANGVLGLYLAMGDGNYGAGKEITDRLEGRVAQQLEISGQLEVDTEIARRLNAARKRVADEGRAAAFLWAWAVLWLVISKATAREFRPVGALAGFLDRLPEAIDTPIFVLLWIGFLGGWLVPLTYGVRPLIRRASTLFRVLGAPSVSSWH
jgi:hypothetical protein